VSPALLKIYDLPVELRVGALIERWKDLNEWTGCRTYAERNEMADIADAILPVLIRAYETRKLV
jgi:hypothetical protein